MTSPRPLPCQLCKKKNQIVKPVPFMRMGGVAMQKLACPTCFDKVLARINSFWASRDAKADHYTCHCGSNLKTESKCHAQIDRAGTGHLSHEEIVCGDCFDAYIAHINKVV